MACSVCFRKFGLFLKEKACPVCSLSHCARCLSERLPAGASTDASNVRVCLRCFRSSSTGGVAPPPPPDILLKRLAASAECGSVVDASGITGSSLGRGFNNVGMPVDSTGLTHEDLRLRERLEALRQDRVSSSDIPTVEELQLRLERLKQRNSACDVTNSDKTNGVPHAPNNIQHSEMRSDVTTAGCAPPSEQDEVMLIMQQMQERMTLDQHSGCDFTCSLQEFQVAWCCICGAVAHLQCTSCAERQLYCHTCFSVYHQSVEGGSTHVPTVLSHSVSTLNSSSDQRS